MLARAGRVARVIRACVAVVAVHRRVRTVPRHTAVGRAGIAVVAGDGIVLAGAGRVARVVGACVAVVAVHRRVVTSQIDTAVGGARVAVVAERAARRQVDAAVVLAAVLVGALVVVIAVDRSQQALTRRVLTRVRGAGVAVITVHRDVGAVACPTAVGRAQVAVVAVELLVQARARRVAGVGGAGVVVRAVDGHVGTAPADAAVAGARIAVVTVLRRIHAVSRRRVAGVRVRARIVVVAEREQVLTRAVHAQVLGARVPIVAVTVVGARWIHAAARARVPGAHLARVRRADRVDLAVVPTARPVGADSLRPDALVLGAPIGVVTLRQILVEVRRDVRPRQALVGVRARPLPAVLRPRIALRDLVGRDAHPAAPADLLTRHVRAGELRAQRRLRLRAVHVDVATWRALAPVRRRRRRHVHRAEPVAVAPIRPADVPAGRRARRVGRRVDLLAEARDTLHSRARRVLGPAAGC